MADDAPKVHWTQTPEGRAHMARLARRKHTKRAKVERRGAWTKTPAGRRRLRRIARERERAKQHRAQVKPKGVDHEHETALDTHVAYLYGKVETIVEYYARSNQLSYPALAAGLARLLDRPARR